MPRHSGRSKADSASTKSSDMFATRGFDEAMAQKEFAQRLRNALTRKRMKPAELAHKTGLGRDSISRYLRGMTKPERENVATIASELGMKFDDLYPGYDVAPMDNVIPALEIRQAQGEGSEGKVWLRVNQMVTLEQASRIFDLLNPKK